MSRYDKNPKQLKQNISQSHVRGVHCKAEHRQLHPKRFLRGCVVITALVCDSRENCLSLSLFPSRWPGWITMTLFGLLVIAGVIRPRCCMRANLPMCWSHRKWVLIFWIWRRWTIIYGLFICRWWTWRTVFVSHFETTKFCVVSSCPLPKSAHGLVTEPCL